MDESSIRFSIFGRPDGPGPYTTGVTAGMADLQRPRGTSLAPTPVGDETDVGRFVIGYLRAVSTFNDRGRPVEVGETTGSLREVCEGGGEVLVTDRRVVVSVMIGTTWSGPVEADRGRVLLIDVPFVALDAIERRRKKALFGGIKERAVRLSNVSFPVLALDLEPVARLDAAGVTADRVGVESFARALVDAACAARLAESDVDTAERDRLTSLLAGRWQADGLDLVAQLSQ